MGAVLNLGHSRRGEATKWPNAAGDAHRVEGRHCAATADQICRANSNNCNSASICREFSERKKRFAKLLNSKLASFGGKATLTANMGVRDPACRSIQPKSYAEVPRSLVKRRCRIARLAENISRRPRKCSSQFTDYSTRAQRSTATRWRLKNPRKSSTPVARGSQFGRKLTNNAYALPAN
uniref:Uncharacterized protein n=1 Tax=Trichuris muris TaxID=70415 RepID=A0A5S6QCX9_TRIMR